ncbi:MAG: hypothetical protein JF614_32035, partial [Acidobacteria bacterium]|nr:hypothetical protein [Acidobacteriota bacterium]
MLVLDSGGVTRLAERSQQAAALILALREEDLWPPLVPSIVLVECLQGHPGRDALANRFLKTCDVVEEVPEPLARRAALLRKLARRGSAVDALVVALAEPGGTVLTSDLGDLGALA